jgi:hypothetical protein
MQYRSLNALGFFGFQLGESALQGLGVYRPSSVKVIGIDDPIEQLYSGEVPVTQWAKGCHETTFWSSEHSKWILATDVNRWNGTFTGLYGAASFGDCLNEDTQRALVIEMMTTNASAIVDRLRRASLDVNEVFKARDVDWSGVLAAAHLRGVAAVVDYLVVGVDSSDEFGTSVRSYVDRFSDHDISELTLSSVPEQ